jgi:hypothetical protein
MRTSFALIFCIACLSGCAGVRQHWADGFGWLWHRSVSQTAKHGPAVAGAVAVAAVDGAVDSATDKVIYGHESPRERRQRETEEFFDEN